MKGEELMKDLDEIRVDAKRAIIEIVKKYGKENTYNHDYELSLNWLTFKVVGASVDDEEMEIKAYCISDIFYSPSREGRSDEIVFQENTSNYRLHAENLDLRELIRALSRLETITERLKEYSIFNI